MAHITVTHTDVPIDKHLLDLLELQGHTVHILRNEATGLEMADLQAQMQTPDLNPNPVMRINADGVLLYANSASSDLLLCWNCVPGQILPVELCTAVVTALNTRQNFQIEITCAQKHYLLELVPILAIQLVYLYGSDISVYRRLEATLLEREARLKLAQRCAQLGYIEVDVQTQTVTWSDETYQLLGYEPQAFSPTPEHFFARVHPEDQAALQQELDLLYRELRSGQSEYRIVRPDGELRWMYGRGEVVFDQYGQPLRFLGILQDISELRQASLQLHYQARLLQEVSDAIIATDLQFQITSWNAAAEAIYGWQSAEVLGRPVQQVLQNEYLQQSSEQVQQAFYQQGHWSGEVLQRRKDGTSLYVFASVSMLRDNQGTLVGTVSVNRDVTVQQQAKRREQLHLIRQQTLADASRAFAEASLEYQPVLELATRTIAQALHALCVLALPTPGDGEPSSSSIYASNPVASIQARQIISQQQFLEHLLNEPLLGERGPVLLPVLDPSQPLPTYGTAVQTLVQALRIHSLLLLPLRLRAQTPGILLLARQAPAQSAFSQDDLLLARDLAERAAMALTNARLYRQVQRELSERKRAEAALVTERGLLAERVAEQTADLRIANSELARAARLKDEFLANMSHELRTPLNSILGRSELLQELIYGPLTPPQLEALQGIDSSGRHLLELINDILDLSKIEAGKLDLQIKPIDVIHCCHQCLQMVAQTATLKGISLRSNLDPQVILMHADERRLKQILVNLLSNAVKFTPEGGRVGLDLQADRLGQTLTFTVWDTGIGIDEQHLRILFQPFVQIDAGLNRRHEGTGLGLALVRRLVQAHHGSVQVQSTPGSGSRFSVVLPWHSSGVAEQPALHDEAAALDLQALASQQALVIEDSQLMAEQLTRYLQELGLQVEVHPQADGAIERAISLQPDLVVLDILLPDHPGWDVLRRLKSEPRTRHIPVLIVSVVDQPTHGLSLGAAAYLLKPIDRTILLRTLHQILKPHPSTQTDTALVITPAADAVRRRILLADDNEENNQVVSVYLQARGYEVLIAHTGLEALQLLNEAPLPALVLMDIQMPGLDGLEAIQRIRSNPRLQRLPIIALTALAMPGDRERCLEVGANAYLSKPFSLRSLLALIEQQLAALSEQ